MSFEQLGRTWAPTSRFADKRFSFHFDVSTSLWQGLHVPRWLLVGFLGTDITARRGHATALIFGLSQSSSTSWRLHSKKKEALTTHDNRKSHWTHAKGNYLVAIGQKPSQVCSKVRSNSGREERKEKKIKIREKFPSGYHHTTSLDRVPRVKNARRKNKKEKKKGKKN